jgi:hypothetical protein
MTISVSSERTLCISQNRKAVSISRSAPRRTSESSPAVPCSFL